MKTRNLLPTVMILLMSVFAFSTVQAQSPKDPEFKTEKELILSSLGKEKKDFVMQYVEIPAEKNKKFWEIYNSYEEKRKMHSEDRYANLLRYQDAYENDDFGYPEIKKIMEETVKLDQYEQGNIEKYYRQMFQEVNPKTAMQFYQVEKYIRSKADAYVLGNLPIAQ